MNKNILKTGIQQFISENLKTDSLSVLLKKSPFPEISNKELAQQLKGKQISQKKFPTLFETSGIVYPKKMHLEQASSEGTAMYKSNLVSGKILLDLTGGMGIDALYFASNFERVICCEKNDELAQITKHNMSQLGLDHVKVIHGDGIAFLRASSSPFDCIYADPSRRIEGKRLVRLEDYEPNILVELDMLMEKCKVLMLKTSPLLDIEQGIKQLKQVTECHIVAVRNEVKELIWIIRPDFQGILRIKAINIDGPGDNQFEFTLEQERETSVEYHAPLAYLYEPNAAILKSGGFKSVARHYQLNKLAVSSHLYTSNKKVDFPGRKFRIQDVQDFSRNWNKVMRVHKANITTRNFGISVAELRKRFRIADGGETYLFFTTLSNEQKVIIRCVKC